ncbi:MAG: helix-turn-helix domain-containing protein [Halanaerobiales bacterium]|nr:helix-turn-helix domain-containing protein [Halanaerobiales bacterium]
MAVSYQVVIGMLTDGKLPGTKIGREWRVPYGVLMEYIQSISVNNLAQLEKDVFQSCSVSRRVRGSAS